MSLYTYNGIFFNSFYYKGYVFMRYSFGLMIVIIVLCSHIQGMQTHENKCSCWFVMKASFIGCWQLYTDLQINYFNAVFPFEQQSPPLLPLTNRHIVLKKEIKDN